MRRRTVALALFITVGGAGAPAAAQSPAPVAIGERVRITTATQHGPYSIVGQVVAARPDTLFVQSTGVATPRAIATGEIHTLEVSRGMHGNGRRGMLYGSLIGVAAGALIGGATYQKPDCDGTSFLCVSPDSPALDMVAGGLLGGVLGFGIGGIWGASHQSERWQERTLGTVPRVGFIPARHGAVLVLHAMI